MGSSHSDSYSCPSFNYSNPEKEKREKELKEKQKEEYEKFQKDPDYNLSKECGIRTAFVIYSFINSLYNEMKVDCFNMKNVYDFGNSISYDKLWNVLPLLKTNMSFYKELVVSTCLGGGISHFQIMKILQILSKVTNKFKINFDLRYCNIERKTDNLKEFSEEFVGIAACKFKKTNNSHWVFIRKGNLFDYENIGGIREVKSNKKNIKNLFPTFDGFGYCVKILISTFDPDYTCFNQNDMSILKENKRILSETKMLYENKCRYKENPDFCIYCMRNDYCQEKENI